MKVKILILVLILAKFSYGQEIKKVATIKIISFKDTIFKESEAKIKFQLVNESNLPLIVTNPPNIYIKLIREKQGKKDTINTEHTLEKINGHPSHSYQDTLKPGQLKNLVYSHNIYGWGSVGLGQIQFKIFYELKKVNKDYQDAESDWIIQYFPKIY